jgi:plastocyanin
MPPLTNATQVDIEGASFSKPTVTITVGTAVRWTNLGYDYHVVTSDTGLFESHALKDAETEPINASFSHTFTEPGTFNYYCSIHPETVGKVIVEALPLRAMPPLTNATQVGIEGISFSKSTVTITVGATVRWTNLGYDYHVVTSDTGLFESHILRDAETEPINASFSYTFTEPGTFYYHCSIHPEMTGIVIVEAP